MRNGRPAAWAAMLLVLSCATWEAKGAADDYWRLQFGGNINGAVYATAVDGSGNLYIGGAFTAVGGIAASNLAKWNGTAWSAIGGGTNGAVRALLVDGSNLYVGGDFTTAGGAPCNYIAVWNGATWDQLGAGANGTVRALITQGSSLYAGGDFTAAGGNPANYVAEYKGGAWSSLDGGTNARVNSLAMHGSHLHMGGNFTTVGSPPLTVNYIAEFSGNKWSALGTGMDSEVNALVSSGGRLWAGGSFSTAGGVPADRVAYWYHSTWSAVGSGANGLVRALTFDSSDRIIAAGDFIASGPTPANRIARWDGVNWSALGSGMDDSVYAVAATQSSVFAGGTFLTAGAKDSARVAQWLEPVQVTLTSASPNSGYTRGGDAVTVSGNGFATSGTVQVSFGGSTATSVSVTSTTRLFCRTPSHATGTVNVVVTNPSGWQGTLVGGYAYVGPYVASVTPNTGNTLGGTSVTIAGTGFLDALTVAFGGTPATSVSVVSDTRISCVAGAHPVAETVDVVVSSAAASGILPGAFTYVAPPDFTTLPSSGTNPSVANRSVSFNCSASDPAGHNPVTITWDFGDGQSATGESAAHIYRYGKFFTVTATATNSLGSSRQVAMTPDQLVQPFYGQFNADADTDIVWWNTSNGNVYIWEMQGLSLLAETFAVDENHLTYSVVGAGDVNLDGKPDLVLRHPSTNGVYVRFMNGTTPGALYRLGGASAVYWDVKGCADVNRDGAADLLFRRKDTGVIYCWTVAGGPAPSVISAFRLGWANINGWDLTAGASDFNADGKNDLLWREKNPQVTSPAAYTWIMDGVTVLAVQRIGGAATNWTASAAGDYDGDGLCDILWRDKSNGQNLLWKMNGLVPVSCIYIPLKAGTNWEIQGPK